MQHTKWVNDAFETIQGMFLKVESIWPNAEVHPEAGKILYVDGDDDVHFYGAWFH